MILDIILIVFAVLFLGAAVFLWNARFYYTSREVLRTFYKVPKDLRPTSEKSLKSILQSMDNNWNRKDSWEHQSQRAYGENTFRIPDWGRCCCHHCKPYLELRKRFNDLRAAHNEREEAIRQARVNGIATGQVASILSQAESDASVIRQVTKELYKEI